MSVDAGRRWESRCEDALPYGDGHDPPLSYTADGTLLVALEDGLVTTRDGCTFRRQPDLESLTLSDLAASPDGRVASATAVTRSARSDSRVARSTDNGLTLDFVVDRFAGVLLHAAQRRPRALRDGPRGGRHRRPAGTLARDVCPGAMEPRAALALGSGRRRSRRVASS